MYVRFFNPQRLKVVYKLYLSGAISFQCNIKRHRNVERKFMRFSLLFKQCKLFPHKIGISCKHVLRPCSSSVKSLDKIYNVSFLNNTVKHLFNFNV
jgi:hypothetical protein